MINEVRNTVLSILSKDNRGYITPFEFNLYAKQAQLEIFTNYMEQYSDAFLKSIARGYGEGYSDVPKNVAESLDIFYTSANLSGTLNVFTAPSDYYFLEKIVYNNTEVEKVSHRKILNLLSSNLTSPSVSYPVYTFSGSDITVYLRLPLDPKWTYVAMAAGDSDPLFNPSAGDYQDFELPMEEFPLLVVKILAYCGVTIRETEVVQIAKAQEMQDIQQNQ